MNLYGLIIRTFATNQSDVANRVEATIKLINVALSTGRFKLIDVYVWNDSSFPDADCGKTFDAMSEAISTTINKFDTVHVHNFKHGDVFCGILNHAVANQLSNGIAHSMIMSTEATSYVNEEILKQFDEAFLIGARVAGVAINELSESVLSGRIANTMAVWDNLALLSVGGFSMLAAKQRNDKSLCYLKGADLEGNDVFYPINGVEEVIPIAYLVENYGKCIVTIIPDGLAKYELPTDPALLKRHLAKMTTKEARQNHLLGLAGFAPDYLKNGILK